MNDTKYSHGTSETEELIDGSFRSLVNYIALLAKSWKLNPLQSTLAIISAVSSLFLLINVNGQVYIWMCALAGLLQLWMCVKKVKIESFSMAFTYSLFSVGSLITAIQQIINYGGYYFSGWRGAERVIVQLVLYALVTMAWILALKKDENKNTLRLVFFVISCVLGAYEVIYVLLALRTSFKLALYGLAWIRYADDIVLLAKSERAAERLLESSTKYLKETLKLKVNREKSRTVSVFAIRNFKFLGFCFGKNGKGIYVRVHGKSWKKAKEKLRQFTSRSRCGSIIRTMEKIKVYMRGWLNYYRIADMKNNIESLNGWLYRRIRMCIWKQWKLPKTRRRKLKGLGLPEWAAREGAYSRKSYWRMSNAGVVKRALTKERLINWGFYDLATAYQSLHVNY